MLLQLILFAQIILKSFEAPDCYSDGLAFYKSGGTGYLFVSNLEQANDICSSTPYRIYRIDTINGTVQNSVNTFPRFYHGLAFDGNYLWGARDWEYIDKMTPDYTVIASYPDMGNFTFGLAYNPENGVLYVSQCQRISGTGLWVFEINPNTWTKIDSFRLDQSGLPDYGWVDCAYDTIQDVLWIHNLVNITIYAFNPATNSLVGGFTAPRSQIEGLTFDGNYLWASETTTDSIYKILVPTIIQEKNTISNSKLILNFSGSNKLEVPLSVNTSGNIIFTLFNLTGKKISKMVKYFTPGQHIFEWKIKSKVSGIYFLEIKTREKTFVYKIIL